MATPTPDVAATVEAGIQATQEAKRSIEATVAASVEATKAAAPTPTPEPTPTPTPMPPPTATPEPTPTPTPEPNGKEKLIEDFFDCLESNLAVAGALTATYDGPLSEQIHTVLEATGDVTSLLHDYGLFEEALLAAMDINPLVAPAVLAINIGCSFISIDEPQQTPEPTPDDGPDLSKCEELALKIIEQSEDEDPAEDRILEITGIEEIADSVLGLQCKGLSHTQSGAANWIEFHQNRLGRYRYEPLKLGDYECEYLVPQIIHLSQERGQEILEILEIQELRQNDDGIVCSGTATLPQGESLIEFWLETNDDKDEPGLTYGYALVATN